MAAKKQSRWGIDTDVDNVCGDCKHAKPWGDHVDQNGDLILLKCKGSPYAFIKNTTACNSFEHK